MLTPEARREELLIDELPDELMVYDRRNDRVHCLNRTAALIWRAADGRRTVRELAELVHRDVGLPADEETVRLALTQLASAELLLNPETVRRDTDRVSRRALARKLSLTAALSALLPVVLSIVAPTPAMAASVPAGGPCTLSIQCISGCCCNSTHTCLDPGACAQTDSTCEGTF